MLSVPTKKVSGSAEKNSVAFEDVNHMWIFNARYDSGGMQRKPRLYKLSSAMDAVIHVRCAEKCDLYRQVQRIHAERVKRPRWTHSMCMKTCRTHQIQQCGAWPAHPDEMYQHN